MPVTESFATSTGREVFQTTGRYSGPPTNLNNIPVNPFTAA